MAITADRFARGMTYDEAKAKMPRNTPNMERIEGQIKLADADLAPWRNLPETFNAMVLIIDPCPDVYTNLPLLQRIANESGKLNVRMFMREENKDLMAQFMNGPFESIPVIAFYDQAMNLRTVFIERPKSVTELRAGKTREIHEANPDFGPFGRTPAEMSEEIRPKFQGAINDMRADTADFYLAESTREFRAIAEELGRGAGSEVKWRGNLLRETVA